MDTRLIGKTIYIGREAGEGRLKLMMQVGNVMKDIAIGNPGSVPETVSRCLGPQKAHCSIEVCRNGALKFSNMNERNVTTLDGHWIETMTVTSTSSTELNLGADNYVVDIDAVLDAALSLLPNVYDIKPLEAVWNEYEETIRNIRLKREKFQAIFSVTSILSSLGILCMIIPGLGWVRIVLIVLSVALGAVACVYKFQAPKKNLAQEKELNDKFFESYVCPNGNCNHFLGRQEYRVLRQNKGCPYCKCQWVEE